MCIQRQKRWHLKSRVSWPLHLNSPFVCSFTHLSDLLVYLLPHTVLFNNVAYRAQGSHCNYRIWVDAFQLLRCCELTVLNMIMVFNPFSWVVVMMSSASQWSSSLRNSESEKQPVSHQQPCSPHSESLKSPFFSIMTHSLNFSRSSSPRPQAWTHPVAAIWLADWLFIPTSGSSM